jgi:hypothetical protein
VGHSGRSADRPAANARVKIDRVSNDAATARSSVRGADSNEAARGHMGYSSGFLAGREVRMPWKESSVIKECLRFVARPLDGEPMTDVLATRFWWHSRLNRDYRRCFQKSRLFSPVD